VSAAAQVDLAGRRLHDHDLRRVDDAAQPCSDLQFHQLPSRSVTSVPWPLATCAIPADVFGSAESAEPPLYHDGVNVVGWIVVGFVAGALAARVTREERRGCIYTIVIGVLGALIGGAIAQAAGSDGVNDFSWRSLLIAFLGACLLLLVLQAVGGARGSSGRRRR
jgi:uncharacterized membrane protein YeaQ/YmgE (transglycosylase-associated protein family)